MDVLVKLFGSQAFVKIMRFFLFHTEEGYDVVDIRKNTKTKADDVRWAVKLLHDIGFLKKKTIWKESKAKTKSGTSKKRRVTGWALDTSFAQLNPLQQLLLNTELLNTKDMLARLRKSGVLKFVAVSGVFLREKNARLDMLIVGDRIKPTILKKTIASMESEMGTELRYTVFKTDEFLYRLSVNDKLIRDVLEYQHEELLNTLDI